MRVANFTLAMIAVLFAPSLPAELCCDRTDSYWVETEYLLWRIQDSPKVIPLVVEGPVVPHGSPVLNQPDTSVVLGGKTIGSNWRSGGRCALGMWYDQLRCLGFEARYFCLPTQSTQQAVSSNGTPGSPFLTVPFFDVTTDQESSDTLARPGAFAGMATLKVSNSMQGAELNVLTEIPYSCEWNFSLLAGLRYWNFIERLSFDTSSPNVPPRRPDVFKTDDRFNVKNNFYGGQIGGGFTYNWNCFTVQVVGKVALGALCQSSHIEGDLFTNNFNGRGAPVSYEGAYFALPTNSGYHKETRFSVIPEAKLILSYQVTPCVWVQIGYTFLYASEVLWATKQPDRNINPTQSPVIEFAPNPLLTGQPAPKGSLHSAGLWVQGLNAGLTWEF